MNLTLLYGNSSATLTENVIQNLLNFSNILSVVVPILLSVAFMTIIERKVLAGMQRRVGPNTVGAYGVLQPLKQAVDINGSLC